MERGLYVALYLLGCAICLLVLGASVMSLLWGLLVPLDIHDNRVLLAVLALGTLLAVVSRR